MLSTQSLEGRFLLLLALGLVAPVALQAGCAERTVLCAEGKLVDSESGPVCVFQRDSALVIEGGFECPASFAYRIETANAIACSERPLTALPNSVCMQIEDCVPMGVLAPTTQSDGRAMNQCLQTCTEPRDCVVANTSLNPHADAHNADNFACVEGVCEYLGCNEDLECMQSVSDQRYWHCHEVPDAVGKRCTELCNEKSDCNDGSEPRQHAEADCIDEVCTYIGCTSDESCPPNAVCAERGPGPRMCHYACETAADCQTKIREDNGGGGAIDIYPNSHVLIDTPIVGELSYACVNGWCEAHASGCDDDADCDSGADGATWRCDNE